MATDDEPTNPRITVAHFRCGECGDETIVEATNRAPVCDVCLRYMAPVNNRPRGKA
jgi:ribosomal protein S27E